MNKFYVGGFAIFAALILLGGSCSNKADIIEPVEVNSFEASVVDEINDESAGDATEGDEVEVSDSITMPVPTPGNDLIPETIVEDGEGVVEDGEGSVEESKPESKVFNVSMKRFEFDPATITVKLGDTVTVNITSTDVTHGFAVPELGVNLIAPVGETISQTFTADKVGSFLIRCSVYCGSGHGSMSGTFIVE